MNKPPVCPSVKTIGHCLSVPSDRRYVAIKNGIIIRGHYYFR